MSAALIIAGIGASAGGLEAMLPLFAHMQPTGRIAYVVAQHMAKDGHDALVVRLIGRESALPVQLAAANTRLVPDTVYVIPSGKDGYVRGETLNLQEPGIGHAPVLRHLAGKVAAHARQQNNKVVLVVTPGQRLGGSFSSNSAPAALSTASPTSRPCLSLISVPAGRYRPSSRTRGAPAR